MNTVTNEPGIPIKVMDELQAAADRAAQGLRDPEAMNEAFERMDRLREALRQRHGILDLGVPAIRALRGELPEA